VIPVAAVARPRQGIRVPATGALPLSAGTIIATAGDGQVVVTQGIAPQGGTGPHTRQLYRSTIPAVLGSLVATDPAYPYVDAGLANGQTVHYTLWVSDGSDVDDTDQVSATPQGASVNPLFVDSFDSGTRAAKQNGAGWQQTGASRITTARAYDGTHAMEFTYPATAPGVGYPEEERFDLPQLRELWIRYYFYLPANFVHRASSPSNNKFLRLWGDDPNYGNNNPKVGLSFDHVSGRSDLYIQWGDGTRTINGQEGNPQWCWLDGFSATRRGQWHEFLLHAKLSSTPTDADGVFECWMFGEHKTTGPTVLWGSNADNYFATGYLMGHSNSGYDVTTTFYIDRFRVYTSDPR
jgi:hypothetical protein